MSFKISSEQYTYLKNKCRHYLPSCEFIGPTGPQGPTGNNCLVCGKVEPGGLIIRGLGFTIEYTLPNIYHVKFDVNAPDSNYIVLVTPWEADYPGVGKFLTVVSPFVDGFYIFAFNNSGQPVSSGFYFEVLL